MAKVNKAFSIDPQTFIMLDRYCAASETWDKRRSRSAVVNEAIKWYLSGDNADLITDSHRELMRRFREKCIELEQYKKRSPRALGEIDNRPWWKTLLGLQT